MRQLAAVSGVLRPDAGAGMDDVLAGRLEGQSAALLLAFANDGETLGEVAARTDVPVVGMTVRGVIGAGGAGACCGLALGDDVRAGVAAASGAASDPAGAARRAVREATAHWLDDGAFRALLLLCDPACEDFSLGADAAREVVRGPVAMAGGGAGGGQILVDGNLHGDRICAVALETPRPVAAAAAHGCLLRAVPEATITDAEGEVIVALDDKPAEDVYLRAIGRPGLALPDHLFAELAWLHPLHERVGERRRLRHVHGRAAEGGLRCAGRVQVGSRVAFCFQTQDTIIRSAAAAADAQLALRRRPQAVLVFDCTARRLALGRALPREHAILRATLGDGVALAGAYTSGEICRDGQRGGGLAHTCVVTAFA